MAYSQFLGPVGLPDTPLRILDAAPPPATVEWLDYRQLWLISFPVYVITMVVALLVESGRGVRATARPAVAVLAMGALLFTLGAQSEQTLDQEGASATVSATGAVQVETGPYYSNEFEQGNADLRVEAEDMGARVTPLLPRDGLSLSATITGATDDFLVAVESPLVNHPLGEHTTWWGVGLDVEHHGESGIGTDKLPSIKSEFAAFGLGEVSVGGEVVATGVPVHVMTAENGLPNGARLELDVGLEGLDVPGLPAGHLRVLWSAYEADIENPHTVQYLAGGLVLALLLIGAFILADREGRPTT